MTIDASTAVVACLVAFAALSFVDGIVVHLWHERLHRRADSRLEHAVHTARAVLFPPILLLFFGGAAPALGFTLIVVDQGLEIADMAIERRSRVFSGGLRSSEYILHGALITLRGAGVAFALVAGHPSAAVDTLVNLLLPGTILAAMLHLLLMLPTRRRATA
jgi:hypothetical protein